MSWSVSKSKKQDETLFASGTDQIVNSSNHNNDSNVKETSHNTFLHPPITGPVRPLSPDTISNLSVEEYDQLRSEQFPVNDPISLSTEKPTSFRQKLNASWIRNKGLFYMLCAQIFGTVMNVLTRLLEVEGNHGKGMHPFQILFARMGITMVLASGYMWYTKTPDFPLGKPEVRWLLVARGFGGFFGVFGMYYSLLYLPLADATVITFLAPMLACWACSILIYEPFTKVEQLAAYVSMAGVVLIARPSALFSMSGDAEATASIDGLPVNGTAQNDASNYDSVTPQERLAGVGVALIGVLGAACAYTTIRWIGKRAHPLISVNYFSTWCTIVSIVAQLSLPGVGFLLPATVKDWTYLISLGTCGFIMQFLLAAGLSYEKSSRGTNMTYTQMLFALAFDKIVFGHTPGWISILGSSLILGSAIFVAVQKDAGKIKQAQESTTRTDEESQTGLISNTRSEHERMQDMIDPVQSIQMRALR